MKRDTDWMTQPPVNPFKVPEGYFDAVADQIMAKIPEEEKVVVMPQRKTSVFVRWRAWAAAAAVMAAMFGAGIYFYNDSVSVQQSQPTAKAVDMTAADNNIDAMADYIMCDDYELYAYLSGE